MSTVTYNFKSGILQEHHASEHTEVQFLQHKQGKHTSDMDQTYIKMAAAGLVHSCTRHTMSWSPRLPNMEAVLHRL